MVIWLPEQVLPFNGVICHIIKGRVSMIFHRVQWTKENAYPWYDCDRFIPIKRLFRTFFMNFSSFIKRCNSITKFLIPPLYSKACPYRCHSYIWQETRGGGGHFEVQSRINSEGSMVIHSSSTAYVQIKYLCSRPNCWPAYISLCLYKSWSLRGFIILHLLLPLLLFLLLLLLIIIIIIIISSSNSSIISIVIIIVILLLLLL